MKRRLQRIASVLAYVAASLIGGWFLGAFISHTSRWIPEWLWNAIRDAVRASGIEALRDEDDIEMLCIFALTIASWLTVALVLGIAWFAVASIRKRRT
ncbi:hypothetical protein R52603_05162 [Paraburkholderia saeva]|uniref:Uncharacterized protein n=1 Tax=Paraburkholderia saeva TaxID=2777537 RepID=A0A9N8S1W6_9BURK|nr:hypothetical protein R70241_04984 [Paraburkholderia saeva]CAG4923383.1 hypothetical protein R52603_05162 [Paraburkholderia saeva]CAG4925539.1 hypothetical protein LMG31841_05494 [Paraburkholderia saeva]